MGKIRQFAGQTVVYGIGSILSKLVYYLLVVVLLTYLLEGKSYEFGTYGELYGYVAVLLILFSFKMDTALFRFGTEEGQLKTAFNNTATVVVLSAAGVMILGNLFTHEIAGLIDYEDKPQYIRWFSFILAFDIASLIPFARLRLDNKAKVFALIKIFNVAFSSILILFFLVVFPGYSNLAVFSWVPEFDAQIDYVFLTNLVSSALVFGILLLYVKSFSFSLSLPLLKKMFAYTTPLVILGVCNNIIQYNGAAVIKYLTDAPTLVDKLSASGVFDSSRRIAGLFVLFIGAFNYAAEPFFFNNRKDQDRKELYGKICHLFVLIGGFIILGLVLGADLVQYLVGRDFRESLYIIPILLAAYMFLGIYHNVSIWYKLADLTKWGAIISVVGAIITLLISILFIPKHGYVAFAWANLISYLIMVVLAYLLGQRYFKISYPVGKILISVSFLGLLLIISSYAHSNLTPASKYSLFAVLAISYLAYAYISEKKEWLSLFIKSKS